MSGEKVVRFPGSDGAARGGDPRHDIASALRDMAVRAEAGELVGCLVVAVASDGRCLTVQSTVTNHAFAFVGAIEVARHEFVAGLGPRRLDQEYD